MYSNVVSLKLACDYMRPQTKKIINFNSASYLVPKIHFFVAQPRIPVSGKLRYLKRIPTEYKYDVCIICLCGSQKVLLFRSCPAAI